MPKNGIIVIDFMIIIRRHFEDEKNTFSFFRSSAIY